MFEFRKFDNWLWFPKKVVATVKLKTRIKSEHIHLRHRRNAINMHMTAGEIFTHAQEVTECFVSVGNDGCFNCNRPRLNRRWEPSRM